MKNFEGTPNFHEVSEKRKELKKALESLDTDISDSSLREKVSQTFESEQQNLDKKADAFKISKFGGFKGAKEALKQQKDKHEENVLKDQGVIDHEAIVKEYPEIIEPQKAMADIADARDFRMQKMFDILSPKVSMSFKKTLESVLKTVDEEIVKNEKKLEQIDPVLLKQVELVKYKEDLAHSGHICITPSVEEDLEAIGDRMLTGILTATGSV